MLGLRYQTEVNTLVKQQSAHEQLKRMESDNGLIRDTHFRTATEKLVCSSCQAKYNMRQSQLMNAILN